jgi:hypothetical protein
MQLSYNLRGRATEARVLVEVRFAHERDMLIEHRLSMKMERTEEIAKGVIATVVVENWRSADAGYRVVWWKEMATPLAVLCHR